MFCKHKQHRQLPSCVQPEHRQATVYTDMYAFPWTHAHSHGARGPQRVTETPGIRRTQTHTVHSSRIHPNTMHTYTSTHVCTWTTRTHINSVHALRLRLTWTQAVIVQVLLARTPRTLALLHDGWFWHQTSTRVYVQAWRVHERVWV